MRLFVFAFLFVFWNIVSSFAQETSEEILVVKEALKIANQQDSIIYLRKLNNEAGSESLYKKIRQKNFYIRDRDLYNPETENIDSVGYYRDSLILTNNEVGFIIGHLSKKMKWPDNLFPNSIAVNNTEEARNKLYEFRKRNINRQYYFSFSKPIFIRNNTISLVAIAAMCGGDCGVVDISFYKKNKDGWRKWISIGGGEF